MEKIRIFERSCLRTCLGIFRDAESDFEKHTTNQRMYNLANIHRIDVFIIVLIKDHILRASKNNIKPLISTPFLQNENELIKLVTSGNLAPETFIYLDRRGFIMSGGGIPILYHLLRQARDRKIKHNENDFNNKLIEFRYSTR